MASDATIVEVPRPPAGRLPFLLLMLRTIGNPVASWWEDFYDEPIVVYRTLGLETVFVMDPELIQQILLDDSESFTKRPLYDHVLGGAGGKGLLIAEGDDWRWQRRIAAPLFRAEELHAHVPAFAEACTPVLARWSAAGPGSLQIIGRDMTAAAMQALEDTILGADLSAADRKIIADAGTAFLQPTPWKIALAALKLPEWTPHPGSLGMRRAAGNLRKVAERVLANRRKDRGDDAALLGRLVSARDPGTGAAMPDSLIIDNVVTFLMVGQETTAQALTWTLYLLALFPEWQEKIRAEVSRIAGKGPLHARSGPRACRVGGGVSGGHAALSAGAKPHANSNEAGEAGGCRARPGATINIPIYVVHRHRRLWQDPLRFDPSRFGAEARAARHRCAYMPFSTGPRSCIGGAFSMIEVKTMLATLLARAKFELPDREVPLPLARITLRPKQGLKLKVTMLR